MDSLTSHSPEETGALGEAWGRQARPGLLIGLRGDLGAGKTQLVKGIARGLGVKQSILSPTFVLVHEYRDGRLPLFHLDLYRLENLKQVIAAGLDQYLEQKEGVSVVEWIERLEDYHPPHLRLVTMKWAGESDRLIAYENLGS